MESKRLKPIGNEQKGFPQNPRIFLIFRVKFGFLNLIPEIIFDEEFLNEEKELLAKY